MAKLEKLAKSSIDHRGEKGRTVESAVESALRAVLPDRFGLGTGFIINAVGEKSGQLDLIIYDAMFNSPLMFGKGVGLFPVECVYGFVEVKSVLTKNSLDQISQAIGEVRRMASDKTYVQYATKENTPGKPVIERSYLPEPLPPRSYVIAVRKSGFKSIEALKLELLRSTQVHNAHIHGLAVLEAEWVLTQHVHKFPHDFDTRTGDVMATLAMHILDGVQSIPMKAAAMDRYLERR